MDKSNDSVTLRPEGTAGIARALTPIVNTKFAPKVFLSWPNV